MRLPVAAVLFDFGNTLFAHDPLPTSIERVTAGLGLPVGGERASELAAAIDAAAQTADELRHPRDLDAAVWSERWHVLYGLVDDVAPGAAAALYADMHAPSRWIPFVDCARILRALRDTGIRVGIVSNTGWDVRAAFELHGLGDTVDTFTLSYEAGCTKPDPRIFATACASLDVDPRRVLMVGDDPRADSGAVRAGMRVLLLPPTPPGTDNGLDAVLGVVLGAV